MSVTLLHPDPPAPLALRDFVTYLDAHLDPASDASIMAAAPSLLALARHPTFLADFLMETLPSPAFQHDNRYDGRVLLLGRGRHYMLRVVEWFPPETDDAPSTVFTRSDQPMYGLAHSHSFSLLTVCYRGPGYETEVYDCDTEALAAARADRSRPVPLRYTGRHQLSGETVMFYPAHRIAHVQLPPRGYSITLNLIVRSPQDELYEQFFFDVARGAITHAAAGPTVGPYDSSMHLIALAAMLREPRFEPHLATIAVTHPTRRVRSCAMGALRGEIGDR